MDLLEKWERGVFNWVRLYSSASSNKLPDSKEGNLRYGCKKDRVIVSCDSRNIGSAAGPAGWDQNKKRAMGKRRRVFIL